MVLTAGISLVPDACMYAPDVGPVPDVCMGLMEALAGVGADRPGVGDGDANGASEIAGGVAAGGGPVVDI